MRVISSNSAAFTHFLSKTHFNVHLVGFADNPEREIRAKARQIMILNHHYYSRSASSLLVIVVISALQQISPGVDDGFGTNLNLVQVISVGHQPKNKKNVAATSTQELKDSGFRGTPQPCSAN